MDKIILLQYVIYFISTLGILMGLDLLLGAKITSNLKKTLDTTVLDIDKIILKLSSHFKNTLDTSIDIDGKIIKTKTRIISGVLFIAISVVMIFVARKG